MATRKDKGKTKYAKPGQPTKYKPKYATDEFIDEYLEHCLEFEELVSLCGFACYVKVCEDTIQAWREAHPEFSVPLNRLKQLSKQMLINKGLNDDYNSTIAKLILSSNHGMAERTKNEDESLLAFAKALSKAQDDNSG